MLVCFFFSLFHLVKEVFFLFAEAQILSKHHGFVLEIQAFYKKIIIHLLQPSFSNRLNYFFANHGLALSVQNVKHLRLRSRVVITLLHVIPEQFTNIFISIRRMLGIHCFTF